MNAPSQAFADFQRLLQTQEGAPSANFALGSMVASATVPSPSLATQWLRLLMSQLKFENAAQAQGFMGSLMPVYESVVTGLHNGTPVGPLDDDEQSVRDFCKGYQSIYFDDVVISESNQAQSVEEYKILLIGGAFDEHTHDEHCQHDDHDHDAPSGETLAKMRQEVIERAGGQSEADIATWYPEIPRIVQTLHTRWEPSRLIQAKKLQRRGRSAPVPVDVDPSTPFVREAAKVGRNDLCPCNSGKKYKRCCGAN